ncbi:50S ribosomal protein L6 [Candidatus Liberibacter africanus]|uniref:Large ribosomal subunit protein uL6 n=1 Tax=Candidatus Liberibacter africanus PTSAPSY TaxID=1277257 RepID=A0A0G3I3H4_LIBAF|nr:50S ribosomal protein L6 [Candidatus Liberibacter africanus]AKK19815.1 50S ribosomal protein L6 [Candidatus Liberibacter africanus PTSAPSY]QTP64365.1 50S ribosomal protein L6 [Candidatus Liberibacter africanus]
MSRIGKKIVQVPSNVDVAVEDREIKVKGPKGQLSFVVSDDVNVALKEGVLSVSAVNDSKKARSAWGMSRTMISNLLHGVINGYERKLEINGVGCRAFMDGKNLKMSLGFSHDVLYSPMEGISISVSRPTEIIVSGIDKQKVGHTAAEIRSYRSAEPYKGKGIRYSDEVIVRKEGKKK